MSLPRPSGLKAPSKIGRPSALQTSKSGIPTPGNSRPSSALGKTSRADAITTGQADRYAAEHSIPHVHLRGPEPLGTDDYKIGDRVWVGGTKPGVIAFIGETQFAPGEWAGVALDEPVGKNDGGVAGIHYFQCEPNKGVFSRLSKLTRSPGVIPRPAPKSEDASMGDSLNSSVTTNLSPMSASNGTSKTNTPTANRSQTPKLGLAGTRSKSTSASSLVKESLSPATLQKGGLPSKYSLKVGDRVLVSGTKPGVLRFIGPADFAKGDWAGVELDDAQGKNDGAVAGKRYFECPAHYGLFAPLHKVTRLAGTAPSSQVRNLGNTSLRMSRERSGSQDSISSMSSTASTASRSRVRLGITSLSNQASKTGPRTVTHNLNATASAIQKALKEKEEHIEQLLQERDLERADVARAAAMVDEAESQLAMARSDSERYRTDTEEQLVRLQQYIHDLERDKKELETQLEDHRRKIEDLQFQVEEEEMTKDDLESRTADDIARIRELERSLKKEKERADKLEEEVSTLQKTVEKLQMRLKTSNEDQTGYLDQIEELTYQLTTAENKIKTYDMSRLEEGAKTSQVSMELEEKSGRVSELEELTAKQATQMRQLEDKLAELQQELKDNETKKQKLQNNFEELNQKLQLNESGHNKIAEELRSLKSNKTELQHELDTSKQKVRELSDDREKLERQMADLMKNSGDSSNQLSMMNEQVLEKNRKVEELQKDLSSSTQKIAKLNNDLERLEQEKEREVGEIVNKHNGEVSVLKGQLDDMQTELSRTKSKISKLSEDFDKEKTIFVQRKDSEIEELKKHLSSKEAELNKQELQTQAHKQVLDQITLDKEALKFEKEKVEKALKRVETEKDAINTELIQLRVHLTKLQGDVQQANIHRDTMEEKLNVAHDKLESEAIAAKEIVKQCEALRSDKEKMAEERDNLQQEALTNKAELQQRDIQIEQLKKEVEKLRSQTSKQQDVLMKKSIKEEDNSTLSKDLEAAKLMVTELQKALTQSQSDGAAMKAELEYSKLVLEDRKKFEEQNKKLLDQMEQLRKSHSNEVKSLEGDKKSMQMSLDNFQHELNQQLQQLTEYKHKVNDLENENVSLSGCKLSLAELEKAKERQKNELTDRIHKLESEALEIRNNANNIDTSGDSDLSKSLSEKEQQIAFLNSVIGDMQRKHEEMKIRLEAMETGVVNGGGDVMMDTSPVRQRAAPRLFCDICDVFDLHDTDDCPKQAMSDDVPPTQYHGDKNQIRPYCDTCESEENGTEHNYNSITSICQCNFEKKSNSDTSKTNVAGDNPTDHSQLRNPSFQLNDESEAKFEETQLDTSAETIRQDEPVSSGECLDGADYYENNAITEGCFEKQIDVLAPGSHATQNTCNLEDDKLSVSLSQLNTCTISENSALKDIDVNSYIEDAAFAQTTNSGSVTDGDATKSVGGQNDSITTTSESKAVSSSPIEGAFENLGDAIIINDESVEWFRGHPRSSDTDADNTNDNCGFKQTEEEKDSKSVGIDNDENSTVSVTNTSDDLDASEEFDSAESRKGSSSDTSEDAYKPAVPDQEPQEEDSDADISEAECLESEHSVDDNISSTMKSNAEESKTKESGLVSPESLQQKVSFLDDYKKDDTKPITETGLDDGTKTNPGADTTPHISARDGKGSVAGPQEAVVMRETKARSSVRNAYSQGDELEKLVSGQSKTDSCVVS
ncbi:CAP-Gly domain-containing linker protein 1-like isoform X3 [Gigantopelta aegis]|uniref:CAP-Gly domain-containing linker protein 1-like isoform X3 n=1 Tax=Gigantopelta aegis TaxID=1735272 RepID=UPI001B88CA58|nr:CAP-Gly domain-containing linker protein 1-like isoform X3 [Gigantopelta aegis]